MFEKFAEKIFYRLSIVSVSKNHFTVNYIETEKKLHLSHNF